MKKFSTLLNLAAIMLLSVAWGGNVWAQDALPLTADAPQVTQDFDGMWDAAAQAATLNMPQGWRIERQMSAPRTVGSYASAATEVMYTGGTSLASNAKNGTWNLGSSTTPSDRAVGGLSTTIDGGTRCVNVMTQLVNGGTQPINQLTISYDIEKYRKGDNDASLCSCTSLMMALPGKRLAMLSRRFSIRIMRRWEQRSYPSQQRLLTTSS